MELDLKLLLLDLVNKYLRIGGFDVSLITNVSVPADVAVICQVAVAVPFCRVLIV
jgi:hypothetical protein